MELELAGRRTHHGGPLKGPMIGLASRQELKEIVVQGIHLSISKIFPALLPSLLDGMHLCLVEEQVTNHIAIQHDLDRLSRTDLIQDLASFQKMVLLQQSPSSTDSPVVGFMRRFNVVHAQHVQDILTDRPLLRIKVSHIIVQLDLDSFFRHGY